MEFKKYGKTREGKDKLAVAKLLNEFPELTNSSFIATEKLDGTNMSIIIPHDGEIEVWSRNRVLKFTDSHFSWQRIILQDNSIKLQKLKARAEREKCTYRIVGEMTGKGILKRIDYGLPKFTPFQLQIDDVVLTTSEARRYLDYTIGFNWWVPEVALFNSLSDALAFDVEEYCNQVEEEEGRLSEGVVISLAGYRKYVPEHVNPVFKIKTKKFSEISSIRRVKQKNTITLSEKENALVAFAERCVNTNRLNSVQSKEGYLTSKKQLGLFNKLMSADVLDEVYSSEYRETFMGAKDATRKNMIGRTQKTISKFLLDYLKDEGLSCKSK